MAAGVGRCVEGLKRRQRLELGILEFGKERVITVTGKAKNTQSNDTHDK